MIQTHSSVTFSFKPITVMVKKLITVIMIKVITIIIIIIIVMKIKIKIMIMFVKSV